MGFHSVVTAWMQVQGVVWSANAVQRRSTHLPWLPMVEVRAFGACTAQFAPAFRTIHNERLDVIGERANPHRRSSARIPPISPMTAAMAAPAQYNK